MSRTEPERQLFLAIAQDIYQDFFERPAIQAIVDDYQIQLLIFEPKSEEVVEWIN